MIIVSTRHNFTDPDQISTSGHEIRDIDLSNDSTTSTLSSAEFRESITSKRICLLVHGYNNEHLEVCDAYQIIESKIKEELQEQYDCVIGYSWPGGDRKLEWWDAKSRANSIARRFRIFLNETRSYCEGLDIISHSLGARVVLKALKELHETPAADNYYCMAGAVDHESLEPGEEFYSATSSVKNVYILHSARDEVLTFAYAAAERETALGLYGPEDKTFIEGKKSNIYVANCKRVISHHGGYKRSNEIYEYIKQSKTSANMKKYCIL